MSQLQYSVRRRGRSFTWEVFTEDKVILLKGHDTDVVRARAAAILAGLRAVHRPSDRLIAAE